MVHICGQDKIRRILEKFAIKGVKSIPSTSVVLKTIPRNPYLSSITGKYAFNLSKIPSFKVYFWTKQDSNKIYNKAIINTLEEDKTTALDWPSSYIPYVINALNQYTTFLNKTSSVVLNYKDSDIVCVLEENSGDDLGSCFGVEALYNHEDELDKKIILFINGNRTNIENIKKGGNQYLTLIHEFGHAFGLEHPHDISSSSTIISGINPSSDRSYSSFSGYGQNSVFNTVMSYNDELFFLPEQADYKTYITGYPETLMPLDLLAVRWLYNISGTSANYITNYGVSTINPLSIQNKSQTIVGTNRTITFGLNCKNVSFYFSNQFITTSNIEPIVYEYNRILEKKWGFYPKDVACTVSVLNFSNTNISNVFIEKGALKVNLIINLQKNIVLNVYVRDLMTNYTIVGSKYTMKSNGIFFKIINLNKAKINVFFN